MSLSLALGCFTGFDLGPNLGWSLSFVVGLGCPSLLNAGLEEGLGRLPVASSPLGGILGGEAFLDSAQ